MLIYHPDTGLSETDELAVSSPIGTYCGCTRHNGYQWSKRVKRRTNGSKWKGVPASDIPKQIKVEALLLGLTL